jgi:hypothetical protein
VAPLARLLSLVLVFGLAPQIIPCAQVPTAIDFNVYVMCAIILGVSSVLAVRLRQWQVLAHLRRDHPEAEAGTRSSVGTALT